MSDHDHQGCGCSCGPRSATDILIGQAENQYNIGRFWLKKDRSDIATSFLDFALKLLDTAGAGSVPTRAWTLSSLAGIAEKAGKMDQALQLSEEALNHGQACLGDTHPSTAIMRCNLGEIYIGQGRTEEGAELLEVGLHVLSNPATADAQYPLEYLTAAVDNFQPVLDEARADLGARMNDA